MKAEPWEQWKLAHAYHRIGSGTTPSSGNTDYYDDEVGTAWITTSELRETYIHRTSTKVTQSALNDFTTLRTYAPNSVFMAMYGATIGRLGISTIEATCNQACCVFESSDKFDNRFLFYWLWHRRAELISLSVGGGQPNLSQQDLKSEKVLCPPLETQKRIAAFLDEKTARIDALIARKQALLGHLAEKRQALITRAVTKGLNPAAPLKDSGIDWLGQIPTHWEVKPLRWYIRIRSGEALRNEDMSVEVTDFDTIPVIGGNGLMGYTRKVNSTDVSIIIGRVGALCGNVHPVRSDSWITDNALGISQVTGFDLEYLALSLKLRDLNTLATRNAQPLMTGEIVKAQRMAFPPIKEQEKIAAYFHLESKHQNQIEGKVFESVKALQEYRAALITSAVTGQLEGLQ
jgi:type I restriction enzyme, S subunit